MVPPNKSSIVIGSNSFEYVQIPLVVVNRFFFIDSLNSKPVISVIADIDGVPVPEIIENEPADSHPSLEITKFLNGIIVVGNPEVPGQQFMYKFRPGSTTSVIFGDLVDDEGEIRVKIRDRDIRIWYYPAGLKEGDKKPGPNVISRNTIQHGQIGVLVRKNGDITLSAMLDDPPAWLFPL